MTYEEYMALPEDVRAEWVDGEAIVFMPPTSVHERVEVLFLRLLSLYAELFDLGAVYDSGLEMRILSGRSSRLPDVLFISRARLALQTPQRMDGAADLVLEIVSDDSVTRDRRDKRAEYEQAGVRDYWLLDPRPRRHRAEFLRLAPDGRFQPNPPDEAARVWASSVPGFWIRPEWFWQDPPPSMMDLFDQIAPRVLRVDRRALDERRPNLEGE